MVLKHLKCAGVAIILSASAALSQGQDDSSVAVSAGNFGCNLNISSSQSIRCCLALMDSRALNGDASPVRDEARALEAQLLDILSARGQSDQPRICPTPTSIPGFSIPDSSRPRIIRVPNPRDGIPRDPVPPRRFQVDLSFGTLANSPTHNIDAGGGTVQEFPSVAFGGGEIDLRFSYLIDLSPEQAAVSSAFAAGTILAFYLGYTHSSYHVDKAVNVGGLFGGTTNTLFEGTAQIDRTYLGAMLIFPLLLATADSAPNLKGIIGANVGPSTRTIRDNAGPFRDTQTDWTWQLEAGLEFPIGDRTSWRSTYVYENGPNGAEHKAKVGFGLKF